MDTSDAERDVRKFNHMLENLKPHTVKLFIETVMGKNDDRRDGRRTPVPARLSGFATGGWTGDYPTRAVAGVVHGQEYVVPAGPAAEYRAFLDSISGKVPGYRDGGFVRQVQAQTVNNYGGSVAIDYDRLAAAVSRARPMYGDAHFHSDGDYERAKRDHSRATAGGGVSF